MTVSSASWRHSSRSSGSRTPSVGGQVLTSAGTAAGIDLGLHIVRLDHGAEIANQVARRIVMPPHRAGGQAQYIETPVPDLAEDDPIGGTLAWIQQHLDEQMTVERLASAAATSEVQTLSPSRRCWPCRSTLACCPRPPGPPRSWSSSSASAGSRATRSGSQREWRRSRADASSGAGASKWASRPFSRSGCSARRRSRDARFMSSNWWITRLTRPPADPNLAAYLSRSGRAVVSLDR
jgi:hypothetical protein